VKIRCYKNTCRHNVDGECSREEVRVDELGMCIDAKPTTQYPQEFIKIKRRKGKSGES
jgi:hypothetical protein